MLTVMEPVSQHSKMSMHMQKTCDKVRPSHPEPDSRHPASLGASPPAVPSSMRRLSRLLDPTI